MVLELEALDVLRLGAYVGSVLNRRPPPLYFTKQLHEVTGGRPLYVEQKLRNWMTEGLLVVDGKDPNRVAWDRLTPRPITPVEAYQDVIRQGLDFLSPGTRCA